MINSKRLVSIARKWQTIVSIGRRQISATKTCSTDAESCSKSVADKGHFVVYAMYGRRFMVPLQYLKSPVFIELLRLSEDAFGIRSNGPITLPCDGVFMENLIPLVRRRNALKEVERDLVSSIVKQRCSIEPSMLDRQYQKTNQHILVHGF